ncbi:hypothetical protein [Halothiobacillus sp.]|uniref:hypothetical protein n=1 Tax=Halothiobacillus sp. TaxID=1891311 RepID=UPI00262706AE|nr:hypothetical protein [Halothiobacillus sp.]
MFDNPFFPYLGVDSNNDSYRISFQDSLGHTLATADRFGDATFLHDEIGRNIGSIQHFTPGLDFIKDSLGHSEGTIHNFQGTATITDNLGHVEASAHQFGDHTVGYDASGHQTMDIHHFGDSLVATDPTGHVLWTSHGT